MQSFKTDGSPKSSATDVQTSVDGMQELSLSHFFVSFSVESQPIELKAPTQKKKTATKEKQRPSQESAPPHFLRLAERRSAEVKTTHGEEQTSKKESTTLTTQAVRRVRSEMLFK